MLYLFNISIPVRSSVDKEECMSACPVPSVWNLYSQVSGTLASRYLELSVPGIGNREFPALGTGWF